MASMREVSRQNWDSKLTVDHINAGSLQRIPDATEIMAGNFIALQNDRDLYKRWWDEERERTAQLYRQIAALKGVITKMKRR